MSSDFKEHSGKKHCSAQWVLQMSVLCAQGLSSGADMIFGI